MQYSLEAYEGIDGSHVFYAVSRDRLPEAFAPGGGLDGVRRLEGEGAANFIPWGNIVRSTTKRNTTLYTFDLEDDGLVPLAYGGQPGEEELTVVIADSGEWNEAVATILRNAADQLAPVAK